MYTWIYDTAYPSAPERFTASEPLCPESPPVDVAVVPPISAADLRALLVPKYIEEVPKKDPWGRHYDYRLNVQNFFTADLFAIRSAGADGRFEGTTYDVRLTDGPEDDLVFYYNSWIREAPRLDPRSRQERTAEQVRTLGDALLSWIIDSASGPTRSVGDAGSGTIDMNDYTPITVGELTDNLATPPLIYVRCVPERDAWGTPFDYRLNDDLLLLKVAAIRSLGADAIAEGDLYETEPFPADERHRDILWADGMMAREPDGSGTDLFRDGFESGELWGYWSCGPGF